MDNFIFSPQCRVKIIKWHHDDRLPIPSYGRITSYDSRMAEVELEKAYLGTRRWWFKADEVVLETNGGNIPKEIAEEMLEIIKSSRPIEHILADLEDLITN